LRRTDACERTLREDGGPQAAGIAALDEPRGQHRLTVGRIVLRQNLGAFPRDGDDAESHARSDSKGAWDATGSLPWRLGLPRVGPDDRWSAMTDVRFVVGAGCGGWASGVCERSRALDGLRGVPAQPDQGARRRGRGFQAFGGLRAAYQRSRDPCRRNDHGVRVGPLRLQRRSDGQAVRHRPRCRRDPGRQGRPLPPRAGPHGQPGQGQLVPGPLARPDPSPHQHRVREALQARDRIPAAIQLQAPKVLAARS